MGIVDMDHILQMEVVQISVKLHVVADDVLAGSGNHEVLLLQTQFLSLFDIVWRIQDLGDRFRSVVPLGRLREVAAVEALHIEAF